MRLEASDPDIGTLVTRIKNKDLDLQPDFQRGEVWPYSKRQKLIDSILRDWHVPPLHVIEVEESAREEVLDGQQRLVAIRDFVDNKIRINGHTEPYDAAIARLHNLTYSDLPEHVRRRFDKFSIRVFRITSYAPDEPGELFFRLNQPVHLTAAEQRNAFFGPVRQEIKNLVNRLEDRGVSKEFIGFSNSRMAYDEVVARLCVAAEQRTIAEKITAQRMNTWYRSRKPFADTTINDCRGAIDLFGDSRPFTQVPLRLNRATLFSWLWFVLDLRLVTGGSITTDVIGSFLTLFEVARAISIQHESDDLSSEPRIGALGMTAAMAHHVFSTYQDRSTSRVSDVLSVLVRDIAIWFSFFSIRASGSDNALFEPHYKWRALRQIVPAAKVRAGRFELFGPLLRAAEDWGRL